MKKQTLKGFLALLGVAAFSVLMGVVVRYLSFYFTLLQQIYLRVLVASVLGFVIFRRNLDFRKFKNIPNKELTVLVGRAALGFLLAGPLWVQGFTLAKIANATFIDAIPMSAVLGFLLLREKITPKKVVLLILTFLGVVIVSLSDFSNLSSWGRGEILVLMGTIFFALRNISRRWHTGFLNDSEITQIMHVIGFLLVFAFSQILGEGMPSTHWHLSVLLIVLIGGFLNIAILYLTNIGFANTPANIAGTTLTLGTVFGVIFGFMFYREIPTIRELFGGIVITLSVIEMNRIGKNKMIDDKFAMKEV